MTFEVVSAFEPLARLERRDGTMDGAVPLRVAQACVPLLEGNALGLQVVFRKRLTVRARLGRLTIVEDAARTAIDAAHRAAVPLLAARGLLGRAWEERLTRSWWWTERGTLRVWTGLLARPRGGTWLRVSGPGNRAALDVRVYDTWIGDFAEHVPLVLDLTVDGGARLDGEVATLVPVVPSVRARIVPLAEARTLVDAHAAFYDAKYFATKKGEVTRKYRRTIARTKDEAEDEDGDVRIAHVAGPRPEIVRVDRVLGPAASTPVAAPRGTRLDVVRFLNAVPFRAHYDGNTLAVEPERDVLAAGARVVEAALGADYVAANKGATLYLTKYFTPHPNGEPHFFVKPWAFVETPRGWSSVVDGHRGPKGAPWSVMRGVVRTDGFHATPAVFHVAPMRRFAIGLGEPLIDVVAAPRAVLAEDAVHTRLT